MFPDSSMALEQAISPPVRLFPERSDSDSISTMPEKSRVVCYERDMKSAGLSMSIIPVNVEKQRMGPWKQGFSM